MSPALSVTPGTISTASKDVWIYGFGSLIQNPGFAYSRKVKGVIRDYRRVFWQGSTDHRGTPERPGRVATLHPQPGAVTWGVAYRLAGDAAAQQRTLRYLEWREKEYDVRRHVDVFETPESTEPAVHGALLYLASSDHERNPHWLGDAPLEEIAATIAEASGPSGPNHVYLFRLQAALRDELGASDPDVDALSAHVRHTLLARGLSEEDLLGASAGDHSHYDDSGEDDADGGSNVGEIGRAPSLAGGQLLVGLATEELSPVSVT